MGKIYQELTDSMRKFIAEQKMFFVATAPIEGRINLSPKGVDTFRVIDNSHVAYLDLTGSGNETAAHLLDNGRMTLMFCSFDEKPMILRLYGRGRSVSPSDSDWLEHNSVFPTLSGTRQVIVMQIESIQTSCGFGVPLYEYRGDRNMLTEWAEKLGDEWIEGYQKKNNQTSIDGLPTGLMK